MTLLLLHWCPGDTLYGLCANIVHQCCHICSHRIDSGHGNGQNGSWWVDLQCRRDEMWFSCFWSPQWHLEREQFPSCLWPPLRCRLNWLEIWSFFPTLSPAFSSCWYYCDLPLSHSFPLLLQLFALSQMILVHWGEDHHLPQRIRRPTFERHREHLQVDKRIWGLILVYDFK